MKISLSKAGLPGGGPFRAFNSCGRNLSERWCRCW